MLLCLMTTSAVMGQTLKKPTPAPNPNLGSTEAWTAACASETFNEYFVNFRWDPPFVEDTNEFILELSDADGDFSSPVELARRGDQNASLEFDFQIEIPRNVQGDNYRLRVRSTGPALIGEASDPLAMYFMGYTNNISISRDGDGNIPDDATIQICDEETATLAAHNVPDAENYRFMWTRSSTPLSETSSEITVSEPGIYIVEIDYGDACSGSANTISNSIEITIGTSQGIAINPPSQTLLCPTESVTLSTNISGMGYDYTWYKNGEIVAGPTVDGSSYTVDGAVAGFEGDYTVRIGGNDICTEESEAVTMRGPGNFTVGRSNAERIVLLPGRSETLTITTDAASPSIQWFRNGNPIDGETELTLTISEVGEYYATVTETGGPCGSSTKTSETTTTVLPEGFDLTIAYNGNYNDCANSAVVLEVSSIMASENGTTFDVTSQLREDFNYQWMVDGASVMGGTGSSVSLASSSENGSYTLEANLSSYSLTSNALNVVLNSGETVAITANGDQICDGATVTIATSFDLDGKNFEWKRNGQSIDTSSIELNAENEGLYQLAVTVDGCAILSNEIIINRFDESVIVVDSETDIVFPEGESQTVTATGGTSYEWFDAQNNLISSTSSATFENEGSYVLVASVNNCQVSKQFTVTYRDDFQIPNVITANGDGINDLWVIPNTYSRQADVTVIIYNELGDELVNQTDYANNWPPSSLGFSKKNQLFYYKIRKANQTLKQGTITVIR